jgi:hypothetical protein
MGNGELYSFGLAILGPALGKACDFCEIDVIPVDEAFGGEVVSIA